MLTKKIQALSDNKAPSSVWQFLEVAVLVDFFTGTPTGDGVHVVDCGLSKAQLCLQDSWITYCPFPHESVPQDLRKLLGAWLRDPSRQGAGALWVQLAG